LLEAIRQLTLVRKLACPALPPPGAGLCLVRGEEGAAGSPDSQEPLCRKNVLVPFTT
jgi:hypothetical protein